MLRIIITSFNDVFDFRLATSRSPRCQFVALGAIHSEYSWVVDELLGRRYVRILEHDPLVCTRFLAPRSGLQKPFREYADLQALSCLALV